MRRFLLFIIIAFSSISAEDLGVTSLQLQNGMRVYLKPNDFEDDQVLIQFIGAGGFAGLGEEMPSGRLAGEIVMESGMGNFTADQLSALLYENSIELNIEIFPFYRSVNALCTKDGISDLLKVIHGYSTEPHFYPAAMERVLSKTREDIASRPKDLELNFEDQFMALNTQNQPWFRPLKVEELRQVKIKVVEDFYRAAFMNPADFIVVIVGNFEIDEIKSDIEKWLAPVTKKDATFNQFFPESAFPAGITVKTIRGEHGVESLTRLTFSPNKTITESNVLTLELTCQVMELRLREAIKKVMDSSQGIDVSYEFPYYPVKMEPWIAFQFRSKKDQIREISSIILKELETLNKEGPKEEEVNKAKIALASSDEYWEKENDYWLSLLSYYYLLGWDPSKILVDKSKVPASPEDVKAFANELIQLNNYTRLSTD